MAVHDRERRDHDAGQLGRHDEQAALTDPYDAVAYPGAAFPSTHPDRLAVQAVLFGLRPARPEHCRVLEIGCGDGGNLLPMALELPRAELVGIDAAARGIDAGRALARELGADNLRLEQADVRDLPGDLGAFDYVIAHGVYSWMPPEPRDALLAACAGHLAPQGVAFVSYNAYPGSYLRDMARDVLRFHVAGLEDPAARIAQARALIDVVIDAGDDTPFARVLQEHLARVRERSDAVLFHDDLAEVNTPVYFHEFVAHAGRHGLRFLAEAHLADSRLPPVPEHVRAALANLPDDVVVREQYMDFIRNRMFRQTLVVHRDAPIRRVLRAQDLASLWVAANVGTSAPSAAIDGPEQVRFDGEGGSWVETDDVPYKRTLDRLRRAWPAALAFSDLAGDRPQRLGEALLEAHAARLVDLHVRPPAVATAAGERPVAPPLARHQAAQGATRVVNLRHEPIELEDEAARELLARLDGSRDRAALLEELRALPGSCESVTERALEDALERLVRLSLLAG
jgi:methyltransferase-like protein